MNESSVWASPPSVTILRLAHERGINIHTLRIDLNMNIDNFINLIHDQINVDNDLLSTLSKSLGGSEEFWKNRYEEYFEDLHTSNKSVITNYDNYANFLRNLSRDRNTTLDLLLDNFKVSSMEQLISEYLISPRVLYSRNQKVDPSPVKLADWIRKCEIVAEKIIVSSPVSAFSSERLKESIPQVLSFSKVNSVAKVIDQLKRFLLDVGVVLIISPHEAGSGVSGLTKTLLRKFRLVVVTDMYKNNASFWFTLLHELSHCILHKISKPLIHYSDEQFILDTLPGDDWHEEQEANDYVESILFDKSLLQKLNTTTLSHKNIVRLGVEYDISASFLVAQIHRMKLAPYNHFRGVFRPVKFTNIS